MYMYVFDGVGCKINTPGVPNFSEIKNEIVQTPGKIVNRSTYPTGLVLEIEQRANKTVIYSNRKLIQNPDGSYTAPES